MNSQPEIKPTSLEALQSGTGDNELSIAELTRVLVSYRLLVAAVAIVFLLGSVFVAFTATPQYKAESILASNQGAGSGIGGMLSNFGGSVGSIAGLMGVNLGTAASRQNKGVALRTLTASSHIYSFIQSENLLPVLFSGRWDEENEKWLVDSPDEVPTLSDGYDVFTNKLLNIQEDQMTGIITLSITWKDPAQAADWANKLVEALNARLRQRAIANTDKTIEVLNQELERTKILELRQAIFFMIEKQIGDKTGARVQEEYAFTFVNRAIPPDADKYISPNRTLIIGGGLMIGIIAGIFAAFFAHAILRTDRS